MAIKRYANIALVALTIIICLVCGCSKQDTEEKAVRAYYDGFVNKDWNTVVSQLADDFTFTSPAPDNDHINIEKFKDECWGTSKFTKAVRFIKVFESGDELALQVEITTTDNKLVHNVDIYKFNSAGKIESVDVFFGPGIDFPGNTK